MSYFLGVLEYTSPEGKMFFFFQRWQDLQNLVFCCTSPHNNSLKDGLCRSNVRLTVLFWFWVRCRLVCYHCSNIWDSNACHHNCCYPRRKRDYIEKLRKSPKVKALMSFLYLFFLALSLCILKAGWEVNFVLVENTKCFALNCI